MVQEDIDNYNSYKLILEKCSNSRAMISVHSGSVYLSEYVKKSVILIYNGGKMVSDIGDINTTIGFKEAIGKDFPFIYAFSNNQIDIF